MILKNEAQRFYFIFVIKARLENEFILTILMKTFYKTIIELI
ncbi:hypothetical protein HMPREF9425_1020 [Streptococcus vestibularis ATCC 49124]|uniref:Uncharacterized protein n=1 Tax=Streptococcus vestibularis ATCC 49124 TaxID=889206 RepID=A0ABP2KKD1_STRVE|nr:hypothetical protein HMPREF9425_1020 [Streptococcus vestibularis ATCC 49124]